MKIDNLKKQWCFDQHRNTNHTYDGNPYELHLNMVFDVANKFINILPYDDEFKEIILLSSLGHDLIEDTRVTYNDVKKALGERCADIIYAVSNEKGKNRKERANKKYYKGIKNTPGATFIKLCDRIANVQYSKSKKSRMYNLYIKENEKFIKSLYNDSIINRLYKCIDRTKNDKYLLPLINELNNLLNI